MTIAAIKSKPHFRLKKIELWSGEPMQAKMVMKPFCKAHNAWPCKECGTSHYPGCTCFYCPALRR